MVSCLHANAACAEQSPQVAILYSQGYSQFCHIHNACSWTDTLVVTASVLASISSSCAPCSFNIKARAGPLDVVHYTVDAEDPSNGLCLSMAYGAWQGNMLMNQPNPQSASAGASVAEQKR